MQSFKKKYSVVMKLNHFFALHFFGQRPLQGFIGQHQTASIVMAPVFFVKSTESYVNTTESYAVCRLERTKTGQIAAPVCCYFSDGLDCGLVKCKLISSTNKIIIIAIKFIIIINIIALRLSPFGDMTDKEQFTPNLFYSILSHNLGRSFGAPQMNSPQSLSILTCFQLP